jgi:microcystin-dependent protein
MAKFLVQKNFNFNNMALESGFSSTLSTGIGTSETTIYVADLPLSVTSGVMLIGEKDTKEWISFTGVASSPNRITGVTRGLDKDATSTTDNGGADQPALSHVAGTRIRLVASHLDIFDKDGNNTISGNNTYTGTQTFSSTTKATDIAQSVTTTQRDALTGVVNGTRVYNTTTGQMNWYEGGVWVANAAGGSVADASTTVAGKVEEATVAEQGTATAAGGTGARLFVACANLVKTSSGAADENKAPILGATGTLAGGFMNQTATSYPASAGAITGEFRMWSTASAPTGWLSCDASAVSRATYAALFAVIGTSYGVGDGSTTFNLPDFRGRSPCGTGTGDATGATAHALATKAGAETHVLTTAEMPAHIHTTQVRAAGGGSPTTYQAGVSNTGGALDTGSTGSDTAHSILHPVLPVLFIIKT